MSGSIAALAGQFLQCSYMGVPFAVMGSEGDQGRRVALHQYPFRNTVWPEDLGRKPRVYRIRGFVVGPTAYAQRSALVLVLEQPGPGLLIHPTIGAVYASCLHFTWREPDGRAQVVEFDLEFVEARSLLTTTVLLALDVAVAAAATALSVAAGGDYGSDTTDAFELGDPVASAATTTAAAWAIQVLGASQSPVLIASSVLGLSGNYGRFAIGNGIEAPAGSTVASMIAAQNAARIAAESAVAVISASSGAAALSAAVLALPEAFRAVIADPADQIDLLSSLAGYAPSVSVSAAPIGAAIAAAQTATAALCRRASLLSVALAAAAYQPTSFEDAETIRTNLAALFQAEIVTAADGDDDDTYQALRALRAQVLQALAQDATSLAGLVEVVRPASLPALVLGQQLYGDATRATDLIARADPVHPAFMPLDFEALSS